MTLSVISRLRARVELELQGHVPAAEGWPEAQGEAGALVTTLRAVAQVHERQVQSQLTLVGQLKAILRNASVGIATTRCGRFELLGDHICRLFGYPEAELLGQSTRLIHISDEIYAEFGARVSSAFKAQGHFDGEQVLRRKDGSEFWAHMLGRGVIPGDPAGGTIWIVEDISAAKAARDQLCWSATHDSLTHLVNRREFEARVQQLMAQCKCHPLCLLYIDLDRFKTINDTAGHAAGDEVLRQISRLLEGQVRLSDTVSRLGGDEFAVLLPGCSLEYAQRLAEQIRIAVEGWRLLHKGASFSVGASIGVAELTPALASMAAMLEAADTACYAAKKAGRNRVATYQALSGAPSCTI